MFKLKLYVNWEDEVAKHYNKAIALRRVKQINALISKCKVVRDTQAYTLYEMRQDNAT